jgi:RNA polymerase sigma-70 factor, ECF subfamily
MMDPPTSGIDWTLVYDTCMPRIYKFFRYRVRSTPLAEDLTATTFEKAWRMRHTYRAERSAVLTWLLTIARNTATDHFRQQHPQDELSAEAPDSEAARPVEDLILEEDALAHLSALMDDLTPRDRDLIALKYGAGLTNRTIAELTGLSESNVGTILSRAVHLLRARWDVTLYER